ncbi:MAG: hypothetical protein KDC38_01380 [Planctomycetes bacterium]|nr:hypothetical protein [Planctomycetota bacterium]
MRPSGRSRLWRWMSIGLLVLGSSCASEIDPPAPAPSFSRSAMVVDLGCLEETVLRGWAYLEDKRTDGVDVRAILREARVRLPEVATRAEFLAVCRRVVAALHDGHAAITDPHGEPSRRTLTLPADFLLGPDRRILLGPWRGVDPPPEGFAAGSEVLEIGGESVALVVADVEAEISASVPGSRLARAVRQLARGEWGAELRLRIQPPDGGDARPLVLRHLLPPRGNVEPHGQWLGQGVRMLRVPSFATYGPPTGVEVQEQWRSAIDAALGDLAKIERLVIDVRGNVGGYDFYAATLLHRLVEGEVMLYESRVRFSPDLARQRALPAETGWSPLVKFVPSRLGDEPVFDGPLYVLQDEDSGSVTDCFLAALQDQRENTVLIGRPSAGEFGEPTRLATLPESGFELTLTVRQGYRASGALFEGKGVTPDLVIERTPEILADGRDPALEQLARELKRAAR